MFALPLVKVAVGVSKIVTERVPLTVPVQASFKLVKLKDYPMLD